MYQEFIDDLAGDLGRGVWTKEIMPSLRLPRAHLHGICRNYTSLTHEPCRSLCPASSGFGQHDTAFEFLSWIVSKNLVAHPPHVELHGNFYGGLIEREVMPEFVTDPIDPDLITFTPSPVRRAFTGVIPSAASR